MTDLDPHLTEAAGRVFDAFLGDPIDWRARLAAGQDDDLFQSADWMTAETYARAVLETTRPREATLEAQVSDLQAENERLREALKPFVEQFRDTEDLAVGDQLHVWIKAATIINARAAYGEKAHD